MIGRVAGTIAAWGREGGYFATRRRRRGLRGRAHPHPSPPAGGVQLAGLVQRRLRGAPAVLGLLHPQRRGHDGVDPRLEHQGGQDLPRRLGLGHQPLEHPRLDGAPEQGRHSPPAPSRFMRGADAWAGTIKSGGKTRRAAKMVVLDVDHPDIVDFVWCKAREEEKALALRDAGFDMSIDGEGFTSIQYQNANNSVRVSDEFMERAERGEEWELTARNGRRGPEARRRQRPAAPDRRRRLALRRSGRPVRHHHQRVAHLPEFRPHQRVEPVLGVHARRRLGLQPRLDQPHEVPPRRRHLRHRGVRARGRRGVPRAGDRGRPVELPDRGDRPERARVPPARPGLRQPRRAADEPTACPTTPTRAAPWPPPSPR